MPEIINHETMKRYDMFEREAGKLRASKKEKAMGEDGEEPLYAKSVVKTLLNELIKDDFRPFTDYDINVAIDKKEMRGDETRFR